MAENNYRSDLDMWQDMWDEAEAQGIHPAVEPIKPSDVPSTGKAQDYYYDLLDSTAEEQMLQEMRTPNPVYPDSVGADHTTTPPVWADENLLKEIEGLKKKLFDVENRMAQLGGDKKWAEKAQMPDGDKKIMSEIEALRKKIEQVSGVLGIKHEPSPWDTKHLVKND